MRVYGPNGTAAATGASSAARKLGASSSFSLGEAATPQAQTPAASVRSLGGIDALIALQGVEDPIERRRRAVKYGRQALNVLDDLKLAFLLGRLDQSTLLRLKAVAGDLKERSGDDGLDQVLSEIELRVAVELAKVGLD
jgi:hypothetical protein